MSDQFDYLSWRGDLSFAADKFNEVDGSILAMLSYINYGAISKEPVCMRDAAKNYCPNKKYDSVKLGLIIPSKKINRLFCETAETERFGGALISDFEHKTSVKDSCQFAAVTYHLTDRCAVISYRGTDDSIVGWREDCCLSYLDEIPAQRLAVEYFERMVEKYPGEKFYLVGHSKGGNLALYAALSCKREYRRRISHVFSYDGPGLSKKKAASREFTAMRKKLSLIVPQSSFIGTMFDVRGQYTVVNGTARGAYQHDCFTWALGGNSFVHLEELSERGKRNAEQFAKSMERMTTSEKQEFVETMFSVIESTNAKSLTDMTSGTLKKLITLIKNYNGMDKEKRALMLSLLLKLFDIRKAEEK